MANSNLTTLLKVQLDKSGIPAELKQIQKIVDKYPVQLTTDLQSARLKKQYQSLCRDMADELNKVFKSNLSGLDILRHTKRAVLFLLPRTLVNPCKCTVSE